MLLIDACGDTTVAVRYAALLPVVIYALPFSVKTSQDDRNTILLSLIQSHRGSNTVDSQPCKCKLPFSLGCCLLSLASCEQSW